MFEDLAKRVLDRASQLNVDFAELRFEDTVRENLTYVNGRVTAIGKNMLRGVGIRVMYQGSIGFSSTSNLTFEGILEALENAYKAAKALGRGNKKLSKPEATEGKFSFKDIKKHPSKHEWADKMDLVKRAFETAKAEGGQSITVGYGAYYGFFEIYTTDNINISTERLLVGLRVSTVIRENGKIGNGGESWGASSGLETFQKESSPEEIAKRAVEMAKDTLKAKAPPAGELTVITRPQLTGVFAHESFGHLTEADHVFTGGSPLAGRLGEQIASEHVTIVDSGIDERGGIVLFTDDEGIKTQRTVLVEKGILKSYLHNRETASIMGFENTGNGRAQSFKHDPIVRMRNTFFESGDWTEEEIIEDTKYGVILDKPAGGQVEFNGTFTFNAMLGYIIENGEIKEPVRDVVLAGNILEMLKYVDAVAKNVELRTSPFGGCGKGGQRAFVGLGGPTLRVTKLLVGGRK